MFLHNPTRRTAPHGPCAPYARVRTGIRHGPIRRQHHVFSRRWSRSGRSLDTRPRIPLVIPAALHACDPCTASPPPPRARDPQPPMSTRCHVCLWHVRSSQLSHMPQHHMHLSAHTRSSQLCNALACALFTALSLERYQHHMHLSAHTLGCALDRSLAHLQV